MQNYRVLHITTHLGGGVGSTILGLLSVNKSFEHEVVAFGYTFDYIYTRLDSLNIPYIDNATHKEVLEKIPNFDIILVHQWNHPLLYDFLVRNELPPCRLIMWGHNSGFNAPNIYTKKILEYPDKFVFTTPLTYGIDDVQDFLKENPHAPFSDIWSTDGVDEYKDLKPEKHKDFIVGYIGTVDYAKLHPHFLHMCKEIIDLNIPKIRFIVVGGLKQKQIELEAHEMGIADKFEFTGFVPKVMLRKYLGLFDIFGYPLASYHYGTCDLVLQIAMGAGVVPVVFNNDMETYMVKNNKTGIIVKDEKEYVQAIKDLYNNPNWREELNANAKEEASKRFTLKNLNDQWENTFNETMKLPRTIKKWDVGKSKITHADVFLESLGDYGIPFIAEKYTVREDVDKTERLKKISKDPSWQTDTKGSVHNYHFYFPDDLDLKRWSELMKLHKPPVIV